MTTIVQLVLVINYLSTKTSCFRFGYHFRDIYTSDRRLSSPEIPGIENFSTGIPGICLKSSGHSREFMGGLLVKIFVADYNIFSV